MNERTCLFCKIAFRELDADIVHEDPLCVGFRDINPQAPVHVLIVPKKHVSTLNELVPEDEPLAGHLVTVAAQIAKSENIDASGYRAVFNCNGGAGQTVFHIHLHVLGGRSFGWPPG